MSGDERIVLDAELTGVLASQAFRARLDNGHELVAFRRGAGAPPLALGSRVQVRMSPFDMAHGEIVSGQVKP